VVRPSAFAACGRGSAVVCSVTALG
jgi:hypothetical protein